MARLSIKERTPSTPSLVLIPWTSKQFKLGS
jgi:hypothetical protein